MRKHFTIVENDPITGVRYGQKEVPETVTIIKQTVQNKLIRTYNAFQQTKVKRFKNTRMK